MRIGDGGMVGVIVVVGVGRDAFVFCVWYGRRRSWGKCRGLMRGTEEVVELGISTVTPRTVEALVVVGDVEATVQAK